MNSKRDGFFIWHTALSKGGYIHSPPRSITESIYKVGISASVAVGRATGSLVAASVEAAPATGGLSLAGLAVAGSIDYGASWAIDKGQNFLYHKLNIN